MRLADVSMNYGPEKQFLRAMASGGTKGANPAIPLNPAMIPHPVSLAINFEFDIDLLSGVFLSLH